MRALFEDDEESEVGIGLGADEKLLWEGRPRWQTLAVHCFHARKVAIYFAILAIWSVADLMEGGAPFAAAVGAIGRLSIVGAFAVGCLVLLAYLTARTTVYRITDRRVLMRVGVAMPASIYIPLRLVQSAAVRRRRDGTGDVTLTLPAGERFAFLLLWPHVRPWRVRQPEPALRGIARPDAVAQILVQALARTGENAAAQSNAARPARGASPQDDAGTRGAALA